MHACPSRGHLQFDADEPQVLDSARAADAAIAEETRGLAIPLVVSVVERVLQHCRNAVVVFGGDEDIAVVMRDLVLPADAFARRSETPPRATQFGRSASDPSTEAAKGL